ncbi:hypothetical protein ES705_47226 [subsurface metagenome]
MARLPVGQKPIVMPSYPHMLTEDTDVWTAYLKAPLVPITEVWYDLHVGEPVTPVDAADILGARIAAGISRKRIDVVAKVDRGYWVIEVKPFAGMLAVGQILSYTRLFISEYLPAEEVWPVIICLNADPDLISNYEAYGIVVITV